ncbi:MAG: ABC transporter permease [Candidatus Bathyarchaeia archaeon]
MLRQVLAIVKKEMRILFRRKSNWFFLIGFPLGLTLIVGYVFGSVFPGEEISIHIDVGIINQDTSVSPIPEIESVSETLIDEMNKTEIFKPVHLFNNVSEALEKLKRGQLDAVMVIHQNFTLNIVMIKQANMTIYVDSSTDPQRYQVIRSVLNTFTAELTKKITKGRIDVVKPYISVLSVENQTFVIESMWAMSEPVGVEIIDTAVVKFRYVEWMLPGILGLEAIFGGLAFSGAKIAYERERGHLRRMLVSPTSSWAILVGEMLWALIRVSIAFVIVISVNIVAFNVYNINWAPQLVIPIIILTTLSASGLGLIISVVSKTVETANGLTNMLTFILQFLIGSYMPTHMLGPLEPIAKYLPWSIANETLRRIMVGYGYYTNIAPLIIYLTVSTFAFLAVGAYLYKVTNKRYV